MLLCSGHTSGEGSDSDDSDSDEGETERCNQAIDAELRQLNAAKKASFKATFDKRYDDKELVSDLTCVLVYGPGSGIWVREYRAGLCCGGARCSFLLCWCCIAMGPSSLH